MAVINDLRNTDTCSVVLHHVATHEVQSGIKYRKCEHSNIKDDRDPIFKSSQHYCALTVSRSCTTWKKPLLPHDSFRVHNKRLKCTLKEHISIWLYVTVRQRLKLIEASSYLKRKDVYVFRSLYQISIRTKTEGLSSSASTFNRKFRQMHPTKLYIIFTAHF